MAKSNVIVVGGGLAGLMATIKAAESGTPVDLFSLVPVKRSHSVVRKVVLMEQLTRKVKVTHHIFTLTIQYMGEIS